MQRGAGLGQSSLHDASGVSLRHVEGEKIVPAAQAKAHLLRLLSEVDCDGVEVVITKRGRPVARLVPYTGDSEPDIIGCMKGTFRITGDMISPEPDVWEAME